MKVLGSLRFLYVLWMAMLTLGMAACNKNNVLEENAQINDYKWAYADGKTFTTEIKDTTIKYDLYVSLRHSFNFEWRNLWINIKTTFPNGTQFDKRVNLQLSEPDGHWYGDCLGDNCDIEIPIQLNAYFPQPGKYTFTITQDMRVSPLNYIKSVGMRIQKSGQ
ncbi:MAG: gliding motility lipoprotein GldH [Chitinophagales bacterium]